MKFIGNVNEPISSMLNRVDDMCLSEHDREVAKAYMRKTEAALDLIWFVGAKTRAAVAAAFGMGSKPVLE